VLVDDTDSDTVLPAVVIADSASTEASVIESLTEDRLQPVRKRKLLNKELNKILLLNRMACP